MDTTTFFDEINKSLVLSDEEMLLVMHNIIQRWRAHSELIDQVAKGQTTFRGVFDPMIQTAQSMMQVRDDEITRRQEMIERVMRSFEGILPKSSQVTLPKHGTLVSDLTMPKVTPKTWKTIHQTTTMTFCLQLVMTVTALLIAPVLQPYWLLFFIGTTLVGLVMHVGFRNIYIEKILNQQNAILRLHTSHLTLLDDVIALERKRLQTTKEYHNEQ